MEHYSGATGCFIDIKWAKLNNIPTCPLTKPIPVYNVDGTANDAGMIMDIANIILWYENHLEHTQLVRGHLSVSLPPLSSPTLPLFICTSSPHLSTISRDYTYSR
jgi:hypothetical protein